MGTIIRYLSIIGILGFATIKFGEGNTYAGLALVFAACILLVIQLRSGSVQVVIHYLKREDYSRAKKVLSETKYVKLLSKNNKAYYYWCRAYININQNDIENVESDLIKALDYGVKDPDDAAIANASLAELYMNKKDSIKANNHIDKAIELSTNDALVKRFKKIKAKL